MSVAEPQFEAFGDRARFALEMRHLPESVVEPEPEDWIGSWGEWRLWVANLNLCELQLHTPRGLEECLEVRWFLAPLLIWVVENWLSLLHEKRLPPGGHLGVSSACPKTP